MASTIQNMQLQMKQAWHLQYKTCSLRYNRHGTYTTKHAASDKTGMAPTIQNMYGTGMAPAIQNMQLQIKQAWHLQYKTCSFRYDRHGTCNTKHAASDITGMAPTIQNMQLEIKQAWHLQYKTCSLRYNRHGIYNTKHAASDETGMAPTIQNMQLQI